jgi:DNA invertase Pin-like site-specific DNA recombinase
MNEMESKKIWRCAIYTRKSTEHNLDLEFNSLDAQREACAAYIKSQTHEGWRLIPKHFDDGAFSGASLERPALQKLLEEVRRRKVDIIVVYKVDRLTRSLADFAKLVELFDEHSASFVSVTQSFNTTSSMGRLTLNVLLSFAQFEREVIGERVRDKIAASKRKGIWVGGPLPLGYASINKKLVVVTEEAETVRTIFRRYLELGSIGALVQELDREAIKTKRQVISNGRVRGGIRFGVGSLGHLLRNRFYVGDVVYRNEIYRGEHEPIVDLTLFEKVQIKLTHGRAERRLRLRASPAILAGRLFDDRENRMSPTHTNKQGARYRYYVSQAILQKQPDKAGSVVRIPAADVETLVVEALRKRDSEMSKNTSSKPLPDRDLIERHVVRIIIHPRTIDVHMQRQTLTSGNRRIGRSRSGIISLPWSAPSSTAAKGVLHSSSPGRSMNPESRDTLLAAIAKARVWIEDLREGRASSFAEIAKREGKVERHVRFLAPLAFASPRVISTILDGSAPAGLTVTGLAKSLPYSWAEQERKLELP